MICPISNTPSDLTYGIASHVIPALVPCCIANFFPLKYSAFKLLTNVVLLTVIGAIPVGTKTLRVLV